MMPLSDPMFNISLQKMHYQQQLMNMFLSIKSIHNTINLINVQQTKEEFPKWEIKVAFSIY